MKKLAFLLITFVALVTSCTSGVEDLVLNERTDADEMLTVKVSMPVNVDTRISTSSLFDMKWEYGDIIYAVSNNGSVQQLKLISGQNKTEAVFQGPSVAGAASYKFVYCRQGIKAFAGKDNIDYLNQIQQGFNSDHIKNCVSLISDDVEAKNISHVTMHLQNSVLRISVRNMPQFLKTAASTEVKWFVNGGNVGPTSKVTLKAQLSSGSSNYIYMAFNSGVKHEAGEMALEFSANGQTARATGVSTTAKTYTAGNIYTVAVDNTSSEGNRALTWDSQGGDVPEFAEPAFRSPVVAVEYTGQRCRYCPNLSRSMQESQDKYGRENYIIAAMHNLSSFSSLPSQHVSLYNEECVHYATSMEVPEGLPHVYYNSLGPLVSDIPLVDMFKEPDLLEFKGSVSLTTDNKFDIDFKTRLRSDQKNVKGLDNIDMIIWVLENDIVALQDDNGKWTYPAHQHIFRGSVNGTWGEKFKVGTGYSKILPVPSTVTNVQNVNLVVLFIDHDSRFILDAGRLDLTK